MASSSSSLAGTSRAPSGARRSLARGDGADWLGPGPAAGAARVTVYDVRGRSVATLVDGPLSAGRHEATLESGSLAAGVYVVRLEAAGSVVPRQAVVVR